MRSNAVARRVIPVLATMLTVVALVCALRAQVGPSRAERDRALAGATTDFLTRWLVERDPATAVAKYLSPLVRDERLLPAGAFDLAEHQERFAGERKLQARDIRESDVRKRMTGYLASQLPPPDRRVTLNDVFAPISTSDIERADPGLWKTISTREPRPLPGLRAVSYDVRGWPDISWTATGTTGFRLLLPGLIEKERLDVQGVVLRLSAPGRETAVPPVLFMLWAAPERFPTAWQFLGVELPPTN